jgi:truncated hemoglobin YjbI
VLDAYLRMGINIPFSCRDGVCHSCKQIATSGNIPVNAQKGLSPEQCRQGFFLPCICIPTGDMEITSPLEVELFTPSMVQGKEYLSLDICKLALEPTLATIPLHGQFINLRASNGEVRNLNVFNHPAENYYIEVVVPRNADDAFSNWVFEDMPIGQELDIQGPFEIAPVNTIKAISDVPVAPRAKFPPQDPVLWAALKEGKLLTEILKDFYSHVYQDPLLSPYFHGTTMQRSAEKVYSFMRQICTGEKVFFGELPKNSHHWMVISDEIYEYREALMIECQRRAGLSEDTIRRWMNIENYYRHDIVKAEPWKRIFADVELPLDGYGEMILDSGSICDGCARELEVGEPVRYHLRLGTLYCSQCNGQSKTHSI